MPTMTTGGISLVSDNTVARSAKNPNEHDIAQAIRAPKPRRIPGRDAARMLREIGEQNARASC